MKPFSIEPLKEFIDKRDYFDKPPKYREKKDSVEDIVFSLIVSVFFIGVILFSGQEPTALVSYETNVEVIDIDTIYTESTNLTFVLEGIPTSIRVTGSFFGNGSGLIFLDPFIVAEKDQLPTSGGMAITGFVVFENTINETVLENVTVEINETNVTSNITVNETIELNLTVNVTENLTILPNITLNFTENITKINITEINITQNITENVTVNENIVPNVTIELEIREFEEYCLETCFLNDITFVINLEIELDGVILNLSHITYTYEVVEEEISDIIPPYILPTENITIENVTTNVTAINITINETLNISINETNITLNITEFNITNLTEINLTNVTIELNLTNVTQINVTNVTAVKNLTEIELFNSSLKNQGLLLLDYKQVLGIYDLTFGLDKNNYVKLSVDDLSYVDIDFFELTDSRLESNIIRIGEKITTAEVVFKIDKADVVLKCLQFEEHRLHDDYIKECKKWETTSIPFVVENNSIYFTINQPGIYVLANLKREEKEFIQTNSVYYMTDCDSCQGKYSCHADQFCVLQDLQATPDGINAQFGYNEINATELVTFIAQFDFDVLNLRNSFDKAEVCAYSYYDTGETTVNYIKYSPESFCSDMREEYPSSDLISYGFIEPEPSWKCIDATEIIKESLEKSFSNIFINWLGQDVSGETSPYNCYWALTELDRCGGHNPSGAEDCRPYLKMTYK